jgi:hypothetical protein
VLHALIFDFLDFATGQLDPAIATIARKACISARSAKRGLANLKLCGVLNWIRRAGETRDRQGRFCLEQDTNAYGIRSRWIVIITVSTVADGTPILRRVAGQAEFREKLTPLLEAYGPGYELSAAGEVLALADPGHGAVSFLLCTPSVISILRRQSL